MVDVRGNSKEHTHLSIRITAVTGSKWDYHPQTQAFCLAGLTLVTLKHIKTCTFTTPLQSVTQTNTTYTYRRNAEQHESVLWGMGGDPHVPGNGW